LPELQAAYSDLSDNSDIQFVLIGSDVGGDTPERVRAFAKKQRITVPLAFDPGCRVRGKFGTLGLPSIVVIDRTGRVCLIRQSYNPAETTFRRDFVRFLETL
jgi:peroxiredoxin